MMSTRYFSLVIGILLLLAGISAFIPVFVAPPPDTAPGLTVGAGYGLLFGILPINVLRTTVHLTLGLLGILAFGIEKNARVFSAALAISYGALAAMGFIPGLNTVFGLIPIYGNNIWFHGLIALLATYFGFKQPDEQTMVAGDAQRDYSGTGVSNQS